MQTRGERPSCFRTPSSCASTAAGTTFPSPSPVLFSPPSARSWREQNPRWRAQPDRARRAVSVRGAPSHTCVEGGAVAMARRRGISGAQRIGGFRSSTRGSCLGHPARADVACIDDWVSRLGQGGARIALGRRGLDMDLTTYVVLAADANTPKRAYERVSQALEASGGRVNSG